MPSDVRLEDALGGRLADYRSKRPFWDSPRHGQAVMAGSPLCGEDPTGDFIRFLLDAGAVFTPAVLEAVREVLADVSHEDVEGLVVRVQESVVEYWQPRPIDEHAEAPFVDQAVPGGLIDRTVTSVSELEDVLKGVDPRWGIEVAQALEVLSDSD